MGKINLKNSIYAVLIICGVLLTVYLTKDRVITIFKHNIIIYNDKGSLSDSDYSRIRGETERALDTIDDVMGIKGHHTVKIKVEQEGKATWFRNGIVLPAKLIKSGHAPVFSEVFHILSDHDSNRFFTEGMAVFFQDRYGEDTAYPELEDQTLAQQLGGFGPDLVPIAELENNISLFNAKETPVRQRMAYVEAGTFFMFIADAYGEEYLRKLNESWNLNYVTVFGKTLNDLDREWRDFYGLEPIPTEP